MAVIVIAALGWTASIGSGGGSNSPSDGGQYPNAEFTAQPTSGPPPLEVSFDASASYDPDSTIIEYEWSFGDTGFAWGVTAAHTFTTPGTYTVMLSVWDDDHYLGRTTKEITVDGAPSAAFSAKPNSGTAPLKVLFDATASSDVDGTIVSYKWKMGDGHVYFGASALSITHIYIAPGSYTVTLTVTDDDGVTDSATTDITVEEG